MRPWPKQKKYWLFKTEPTTYSIHDLAKEPSRRLVGRAFAITKRGICCVTTSSQGDTVLIYHSNANPPAVVGTATVVRGGYPDHFAWNSQSKYYDEKSDEENPRWFMVDVKLRQEIRSTGPATRTARDEGTRQDGAVAKRFAAFDSAGGGG